MPVVTVVLTNHPSYVCYLGSCFRVRCRPRWVAVQGAGGAAAIAWLTVFCGVWERWARFVALCCFAVPGSVPSRGRVAGGGQVPARLLSGAAPRGARRGNMGNSTGRAVFLRLCFGTGK